MSIDRRDFLRDAVRAAGLLLLGCETRNGRMPHSLDGSTPASDRSFIGGKRMGIVPFVDEDIPPLNTLLGYGWDGRLYFDHSRLAEDSLIVSNDRFYVRTLYPDRLVAPDPWVLRVHGLVREAALFLPDLLALEQDMGIHLLECSGNRGAGFGLISAARWRGILVADLLQRVERFSNATQVLFSGFDEHSVPSAGGHSTPGASWVFDIQALLAADAFLATGMNGEPLPDHHGKPLRLFVPGWYGCTAIKWLNEMIFVDDAEPPTPQMIEFASRTHQADPPPALARDFLPATVDQAAMPIRVERWQLANGEPAYRVVGVCWGGYQVTDAFEIQLGDGDWEPVALTPPPADNRTWSLWAHAWRPRAPGKYAIRMRTSDPKLAGRRLTSDWYTRQVQIA